MTHVTLATEFLCPILVLMPPTRWPLRRWAGFALIGMHLGIDFTFYTGGFQYVMIAGNLLLLDSGFWNACGTNDRSSSSPILKRHSPVTATVLAAIMGSCMFYAALCDVLQNRSRLHVSPRGRNAVQKSRQDETTSPALFAASVRR